MGAQIELLATKRFNRKNTDSLYLQAERGHLTHLLIVARGTTFRQKDRITAKLRHDGGTITVIDRVSAADLVQISDLKLGIPAYGSVFKGDQGNGDYTTENQTSGLFSSYGLNAICIPVGSIYLNDATFEMTAETALGGSSQTEPNATNDGTGEAAFSFYFVDAGHAPAHVLQWDSSYDLESNQKLVRELYLCHKEGGTLFPSAELPGDPNYVDDIKTLDIQVQLDIDNFSKICDLAGYGALTSLFGEMSRPASSVVRIFQDDDAIPSNLWMKLTGDDRDKVSLLAVREVMVPSLTLAGHTAKIDVDLRKTEALEKTDFAAAKAYQAAGLAPTSAAIQAVKEEMPAKI